MKKLSFSILFVLFILVLCSPNYGQAICPITTLKIGSVKGKVLWNDKTVAPITRTKVELIRLGEEDFLISSTLTNENGFFEISNLEKGKYGLDVWLYVDEKPYFVYRVALKVTKSNATKSDSLIVVKLGLDCWTSEAQRGKINGGIEQINGREGETATFLWTVLI